MRLEEVVAELKRFFDDQDDVDVAYLFGSAARGRRLPDSDVDVGILFANGFGGDGSARGAAGGGADGQADASAARRRVFRRIEMAQALEARLGCPVDVVDLELCSPVFNHHVLRNKIIVKGRDAPKRIAFEKAVRREYFGFLPYYTRYVEASLQRLREGGDGGGGPGHPSSALEAARRVHQRLGERATNEPEGV